MSMLGTIRSYTNHTVIGIVAEGIPSLAHSIRAVVHKIAISTIVQIVISIPLFYLQHNLFALGFIVGFVFDKQVRQIVDKVNIVYQSLKQRSYLEGAVIVGGVGFTALLALPTSMVIVNLYYSTQWGSALYQTSYARYKKEHPAEDDMELDPVVQPKAMDQDTETNTVETDTDNHPMEESDSQDATVNKTLRKNEDTTPKSESGVLTIALEA